MLVQASAGAQIRADQLVDVVGLLNAYYDLRPDAADPAPHVSFQGMEHLRRIQEEARAIVATALAGRTP
jgi:hypothetical protein